MAVVEGPMGLQRLTLPRPPSRFTVGEPAVTTRHSPCSVSGSRYPQCKRS